jgi:hypothetical protein
MHVVEMSKKLQDVAEIDSTAFFNNGSTEMSKKLQDIAEIDLVAFFTNVICLASSFHACLGGEQLFIQAYNRVGAALRLPAVLHATGAQTREERFKNRCNSLQIPVLKSKVLASAHLHASMPSE